MTGSQRVPVVGDVVTLGDTVALGIEPGERWARVVGIRDHRHPFIVREFRCGDTWFPTGEYRTTSAFGMCPWGQEGIR